MTSTPPPTPSDETPDELDEFVARRVRNALAEPPPIDAQRRARHVAAALSAFDEAATEVTGQAARTARSWWRAASVSAAAVVLIVVGAVVIANGGSDAGNDAGNDDLATASLDASQNDASADAARESAESVISGSAEPSSESAADAPTTPGVGAERSSAAPIDLGAFDSIGDLAEAVRARVDRPDEAGAVPTTGTDGTADATDVDSWDATRSTSICDTARFAESGRFSVRFTATVAGVPYLVAVDRLSGRVVGVNLLTCAETES